MIRTLLSLDSLNRGGSEILALDVCRNARRCGIDLTFVATGGGTLERDFEHSGADYVRFQREQPVDLNLALNLRKVIKEKNIEIVHGFQPVESLHLYMATFGTSGVARVLSHHGGGLFFSKRKNLVAARYLSPRMDANVVPGRGLFRLLREEVGLKTDSNFFLVHNGVDEKRLTPSSHSVRSELGIGAKDILIGMVANFVPTRTKDQETVCRALPKVFDKFKNGYFVFAGNVVEGGETVLNNCVRICDDSGIGDRVFFLGERTDINNILGALDLFVFSSLHEGLPIAVAETMLAGVPLVVSDIDPLLEITNEGKCASVFRREDGDELAEKIISLLRSERLRKKRAAAARDYAIENFEITAHLNSLRLLYSKLLNKAE